MKGDSPSHTHKPVVAREKRTEFTVILTVGGILRP
jgi:hypothetical protein